MAVNRIAPHTAVSIKQVISHDNEHLECIYMMHIYDNEYNNTGIKGIMPELLA